MNYIFTINFLNQIKMRKQIILTIIAVMAFAVTASAKVNSSINGFFKNEKSYSWETVYIEYNTKTGRAKVWYTEESSWDGSTIQHFEMSGSTSNGWIKVSGRGVANGRQTRMTMKITLESSNKIRVIMGGGSSRYYYRD